MSNTDYMLVRGLPHGSMINRIKGCSEFMVINIDFDNFTVVENAFNLAFGNIKEKEHDSVLLRKLISVLAAVNERSCVGTTTFNGASDIATHYYLDTNNLSDPKNFILLETLKNEQEVAVGARMWFCIMQNSCNIGSILWSQLLDNVRLLREAAKADLNAKKKGVTKNDNPEALQRAFMQVTKDTWIHEVCKQYADSDILETLHNNITENNLKSKEDNLNPINFFSPERMIRKAPVRTCSDQKSIETYFNLASGGINPMTFNGFPFPEDVTMIKPQFFTPTHVSSIPIPRSSVGVKRINKNLNDKNNNRLILEEEIIKLHKEGNESLAIQRENELIDLNKEIEREKKRKEVLLRTEMSKKINLGYKGATDFKTLMDDIKAQNWTIEMHSVIEEEERSNPHLQLSKAGTKEYKEAMEKMRMEYIDVFARKCLTMERMVPPFKAVVNFKLDRVNEYPFLPTVCTNLSPIGNVIVSLAYTAEKVLGIYGPITTYFVNLACAWSSAHYTMKPRAHTMISGGPGTGKTTTTLGAMNTLVPGTSESTTYKTSKSDTVQGDVSDSLKVFQEAPYEMLGVDNRGKPVPEDPVMKSILSEGFASTDSWGKTEDGQRTLVKSFNRAQRNVIVNSNNSGPTPKGALASRFLTHYIEKHSDAYMTVEQALLSTNFNDKTKITEAYIETMRRAHSILFMWEKLQEAKVFPQIDTRIYKIVCERFYEALKNKGFEVEGLTRKIPQLEAVATAFQMMFSIFVECGELGERIRNAAQDEEENDNEDEEAQKIRFIQKELMLSLPKWSVISEEVTIFVLSLYAPSLVPLVGAEVTHALAEEILQFTIPDEKRHLTFTRSKNGGLLKGDLNRVSFKRIYHGHKDTELDYNYITIVIPTSNLGNFYDNIKGRMTRKIDAEDIRHEIQKLRFQKMNYSPRKPCPKTDDLIIDTEIDIDDQQKPVVIVEELRDKTYISVLVEAVLKEKPHKLFDEALRCAVEFRDMEPKKYVLGRVLQVTNANNKTDIIATGAQGHKTKSTVTYTSILEVMNFYPSDTPEVITNTNSYTKADQAFLFGVPKEDAIYPESLIPDEDDEKRSIERRLALAEILVPSEDFQDTITINFLQTSGLICKNEWNEQHPYSVVLRGNSSVIIENIRRQNPKYNGLHRIVNYPEDLIKILEEVRESRLKLKSQVDTDKVRTEYDASVLLNTCEGRTLHTFKLRHTDGSERMNCEEDTEVSLVNYATAGKEQRSREKPKLDEKRNEAAIASLTSFYNGNRKRNRRPDITGSFKSKITPSSSRVYDLDKMDDTEEAPLIPPQKKQHVASSTSVLRNTNAYESDDDADPHENVTYDDAESGSDGVGWK
jgi:hypothetical protein